MQIKVLITFISLVLILNSCIEKPKNINKISKNEVIICNNKKSDKDITINLLKEKEIVSDSISTISKFDVDLQNNIYIFDGKEMTFYKTDSNGKILIKFGKRGGGPGEYGAAGDFILFKNKIYVPDMITKKIVIFRNDGSFVKFIDGLPFVPTGVKVIDNNLMLGYCVVPTFKEDGMYIKSNLSIIDSTFLEKKVLLTKEMIFNAKNMFSNDNEAPRYTSNKGNLTIAPVNENKYEIQIFDTKGNLKKKICRSYKKVSYSKEEIDNYQKKIDARMKGKMKAGSLKFNRVNKLAINWLDYDKYDRLWVEFACEANKIKEGFKKFDIFDKKGNLLGQTTIKLSGDISFKNDKIYSLDKDSNKIIVWNY